MWCYQKVTRNTSDYWYTFVDGLQDAVKLQTIMRDKKNELAGGQVCILTLYILTLGFLVRAECRHTSSAPLS